MVDKTRLVLAEKENEMTKAQAEKEKEVTKAQAEKAVAQAELEATSMRLQAKNMESLRLANSVNLRGAIGKCRGSVMCPWSFFSLTPLLQSYIYL